MLVSNITCLSGSYRLALRMWPMSFNFACMCTSYSAALSQTFRLVCVLSMCVGAILKKRLRFFIWSASNLASSAWVNWMDSKPPVDNTLHSQPWSRTRNASRQVGQVSVVAWNCHCGIQSDVARIAQGYTEPHSTHKPTDVATTQSST